MIIRKLHLTLLLVCLLTIGAVISIIIIGQNEAQALVRVESEPKAAVYVDARRIGSTPLEYELAAGTATIKIVPEDSKAGYLPYETQLSLTPHTKVIVRHKFADQPQLESNQIISFQKNATKDALMTVITNPSESKVFMDNMYVGTSPLEIVRPNGVYALQVIKEGFSAVSFQIQNAEGYNAIAAVDLPRQSAVMKAALQRSPIGTATILPTPTGFLFVRISPQESAQELARVSPGREYPLFGKNAQKDWLEIGLNASESGWIKAQYVKTTEIAQ